MGRMNAFISIRNVTAVVTYVIFGFQKQLTDMIESKIDDIIVIARGKMPAPPAFLFHPALPFSTLPRDIRSMHGFPRYKTIRVLCDLYDT